MTTFVIVHGAFGGGWEWTGVARELRRMGHEVFTPTLTGMGERSHLGPAVGMRTHIEDVVALLQFEDLHDVVLCGASYGGMAATGAADRVAGRVALVLYIDALIPADGQCGVDLLPAWFRDVVEAASDEHGHGWVPVPDVILPPTGLIPENEMARYVARLRPQPVATFTEPVILGSALDQLPRGYIRCTRSVLEGDPIAPMAAMALSQAWPYRELATPHDPQLFDPIGTAEVLNELTAAVLGAQH